MAKLIDDNMDEMNEVGKNALADLLKIAATIIFGQNATVLSTTVILQTSFLLSHTISQRRLRNLANAFRSREKSLEDFYKLPVDKQEKIMYIIYSELSVQTDDLQAEALGFLLRAFLEGKIDDIHFRLLSHEIKNINPVVFEPEYEINLTSPDAIPSNLAQLLPSSFWSSSSEISGSISMGNNTSYLTNIGLTFYNNVYVPMMNEKIEKKNT